MLNVMVLGSAAGGGVPQWNCNCAVCRAARSEPRMHNGQVCAAVSADGGRNWFLVNASPDLRQQILATPALAPEHGRLRHSPIAGVILTNGEVDAVAGLLSLREGAAFSIHAHPRVLEILAENSIFNVLDPARVPRRPIALGAAAELALPDGTASGLILEAFDVPGKPAWFLENTADGAAPREGDTIGLMFRSQTSGRSACFVPACADVTPALEARLGGVDLLFFDGTLWRDDEMIRAGLGPKTGQRMGHLSMSGPDGSIARLAGLGIGQKVFVHINNSNPVLMPGSAERREAEAAGWCIPDPGREFTT